MASFILIKIKLAGLNQKEELKDEYRNIFFTIESIISNEEIEKILKQLENCDSSGLDIKFLNHKNFIY